MFSSINNAFEEVRTECAKKAQIVKKFKLIKNNLKNEKKFCSAEKFKYNN